MDIFTINGIDADYEDFGEKYDRGSGYDYPNPCFDQICENMQFTGIPPTPGILEKYHITGGEYDEIVQKLTEGLSFGFCGMCV